MAGRTVICTDDAGSLREATSVAQRALAFIAAYWQATEHLHGKGGGRRYESVRGLCKRPAQRLLIAQSHLLLVQHAVGMEPFMEPSGRKLLLRLGPRALSRSYRKPPKSR